MVYGRSVRRAVWLVLAIPVAAGAAGVVHKAGTEQWTQVSGASASSQRDAVLEAYYGLEALKLWQFDQRVCRIELGRASFATQQMSWVPQPLKVCDPKVQQNWKYADLGPGRFITAIAVCTDEDATSIQGIEVWGAVIADGKRVQPDPASAHFEFDTCEKWHERRTCPAGSIATGIRATFEDQAAGIVGLALRCHQLDDSVVK